MEVVFATRRIPKSLQSLYPVNHTNNYSQYFAETTVLAISGRFITSKTSNTNDKYRTCFYHFVELKSIENIYTAVNISPSPVVLPNATMIVAPMYDKHFNVWTKTTVTIGVFQF